MGGYDNEVNMITFWEHGWTHDYGMGYYNVFASMDMIYNVLGAWTGITTFLSDREAFTWMGWVRSALDALSYSSLDASSLAALLG